MKQSLQNGLLSMSLSSVTFGFDLYAVFFREWLIARTALSESLAEDDERSLFDVLLRLFRDSRFLR